MTGPRPTHQWRGVIEEYRDRLPGGAATQVVTLREGGTPLVPAQVVSERTGCEVHLKVEGANPTGSFKDRGMTMAVTKAVEAGARAIICASTGNTSAAAAADADVLPVDAHTTTLAPSSAAFEIATVMPRSLNDPVGFEPSSFSHTSAPTRSETCAACTSGVEPSPSVMTGSPSSNGRRSLKRSMSPMLIR